jgi:NADH-quinone oxidoreductase subunit G
VLRVLGNLLDAENFDYQTSEEVADEFSAALGDIVPDNAYTGKQTIGNAASAGDSAAIIDIPIYRIDAVVRRATALQLTPEAQRSAGERE